MQTRLWSIESRVVLLVRLSFKMCSARLSNHLSPKFQNAFLQSRKAPKARKPEERIFGPLSPDSDKVAPVRLRWHTEFERAGPVPSR
jgi:hypothetical protein